MSTPLTLRFGTRGSRLARRQTEIVVDLIRAAHPEVRCEVQVFSTHGDRTQALGTPLPLIGGKGVFTAELEHAIREGRIDCAVHSLKDLPTAPVAGIVIGCVPVRASALDVLVSRSGWRLNELPGGAVVGTSSLRRSSQLLFRRRDLRMLDIRGNVDTRIRKATDPDGPYDATVLALAGLERLDIAGQASEVLSVETMLPAPGQGAIGVQCRPDGAALVLLRQIEDAGTLAAVTAERGFLSALGGGCSAPVAALGVVAGGRLTVRGRVTAVDGSEQTDVSVTGDAGGAEALGIELARLALAEGARAMVAEARV